MINSVILVGKLFSLPETIITRDNSPAKWAKFILAVERPFKNRQHEYEIDYVTVKTWVANCEEIKNLLTTDVVLGIRGRIQTFNPKNNEFHYTEIVAERIVYIE